MCGVRQLRLGALIAAVIQLRGSEVLIGLLQVAFDAALAEGAEGREALLGRILRRAKDGAEALRLGRFLAGLKQPSVLLLVPRLAQHSQRFAFLVLDRAD